MAILKDAGVPVHGFYVKDWAKQDFQEIAEQTGGKSEFLDVNSP